jgi:hypothetical protein
MNASAWPVVAFVIAGALLPPRVGAQTCAAPLPVYPTASFTGSTCGQNLLPALNHGTVLMPGDDIVYHLPPGHYEGGATVAVVTTNDPNFHPALFLCSAPCGSESQCVGASDSGSADKAAVAIPQDENDYYLIVDSQVGCGDYWLVVNGFFGTTGVESDATQ